MKFLSQLTCCLLLSTIASCQPEVKYLEVSANDINQEQLEFATTISQNLLSAQKDGTFYELTDEQATPQMISGLNEAIQKQSYQQVQSAFGDYQDLIFVQLMKPVDGSLFEIYRYKGKFNPGAQVEVRTVLDANGKLAGFFIKPWKDNI